MDSKASVENGLLEWCLKRNFVQNGNQIEYDEIKGADNIVEHLRHLKLDLELFGGSHLYITFPLTLSKLYTVRVNSNANPDVYYEIIHYSSNCYGSFITHTSSPLPTSPCSQILSKVFIWPYLHEEKHYERICKALSLPSDKPFFTYYADPPRYLGALLQDLDAAPAVQPPEFDYDSTADMDDGEWESESE